VIDPINPGPAGTDGPAGVTVTGPSPQFVAAAVSGGGTLLAAATQTLAAAVQQAFQSAADTVKAAVTTLASTVTTELQSAQTTATLSGSTLQGAAGAALVAAQAPLQTQYTADQGGPNYTTGWNLWSVRVPTGWTAPIPEQYWANYENDLSHCFRGWAQVYEDALALANSLPPLPPDSCPQPASVVTPSSNGTVSPSGCTLYSTWQRINPDGTATCIGLCDGAPGPAGFTLVSSGQRLDALAAPPGAEINCFVSTPTGGSPQYYGGCDSQGNPVAWLSTATPPAGVSAQVGPFPDMSSALTAANCVAPPSGGPPPTGGPTSTGPCCDTSVTKLPDCIYIDLCSPEKAAQAIYMGLCKWSQNDDCFYDPIWRAIKKGLCEFISDPECRCKADDADRSMWEDCSGSFGNTIAGVLGKAGAPVYAMPLDQVVQQAMQISGLGGG
jgi:hypothetical protein